MTESATVEVIITMSEQKPEQTAEATPRAAGTVTPTPQPNEIASFLAAMSNGTLPHIWTLKPDGSPVSPGAFDPVQKTPTWP